MRGRVRLVALLAVVTLATSGLVALGAAPAEAATTTFFINSNATHTGTNTQVQDQITAADCTSGAASGTCTIQAAFTKANAVTGTDPVVITVAAGYTGGVTVYKGGVTANLSSGMGNNLVPDGGSSTRVLGAILTLTRANTTIDFRAAAGINNGTDPDYNGTALYINAGNVVLKNARTLTSGKASITLGPSASGVTLSNLDLVPTNTAVNRQVMVLGGASNITIANSTFNRLYPLLVDSDAHIVFRPTTGTSGTISNVTIVGNRFPVATGGNCLSSDTSGCRAVGILAGDNVTVNGLVINDNVFDNWQGGGSAQASVRPIMLNSSSTVSNLAITGNRFTNMQLTTGNPAIHLPDDKALGGSNVISGNVFIAAGTTTIQTRAIHWNRNLTAASVAASGLTIAGNSFTQYGSNSSDSVPTIDMSNVGTVTVERNMFDKVPSGFRNPATSDVESDATGVVFGNDRSNRRIRTFVPTALTVTGCSASLTLATPSDGGSTDPTISAANPGRVDVYWSPSGSRGAEVLVQSFEVTQWAGVTVNLASYPFNEAGLLRVQTTGGLPAGGTQRESSQYSRVLQAPAAACAPAIVIDRGAQQPQTTSFRDLVFRVTANTTLDQAPTAASFTVAATGTATASIASISAVSATSWNVVVRSNDTATVTLSMPAGAVKGKGAGTVSTASTSTTAGGNTVNYTNPLSIAPTALTVYEGDAGSAYTATIASGDVRTVPQPRTPVTVTAALSGSGVALQSGSMTLPIGIPGASITATALSPLGGQTQTAVASNTVTATGTDGAGAALIDVNFDGLRAPQVTIQAKPNVALSPPSGTTRGGTSVTLVIARVPAGATAVSQVLFGGKAATITASDWSTSTVTVTTPPRAGCPTTLADCRTGGAVDVSVAFTGTTSLALAPAAFTYVATPGMSLVTTAYADAARTVVIPNGTSAMPVGAAVYFNYLVTNTGDTTLTLNGVATTPGVTVTCPGSSLGYGASITCTGQGTVSAP